MAKDIEQIEREVAEEYGIADPAAPAQKTHKGIRLVSDIIFYGVLSIMVISAFLYSQSAERGKTLLGFSYYNVLSSSMSPKYPRGSLVMVRQVDPAGLETGDAITFFSSKNVVVTHGIVKIIEDYEGTGQRGFQTQGLANPEPDSVIVFQTNVIGKVVWHIPVVGYLMNFVGEHVVFCIFAFVAAVGIASCLRVFFAEKKKTAHESSDDEPKNIESA